MSDSGEFPVETGSRTGTVGLGFSAAGVGRGFGIAARRGSPASGEGVGDVLTGAVLTVAEVIGAMLIGGVLTVAVRAGAANAETGPVVARCVRSLNVIASIQSSPPRSGRTNKAREEP